MISMAASQVGLAMLVALIAAIDRLEGASENFDAAGVPFETLFTKKDLGVQD